MSEGDKILAMKPEDVVGPTQIPAAISRGLIADLKRDEGLCLRAYPDPVSHGDPWTIGYGHTGPEVHQGLLWTQAQADAALIADILEAQAQLDARLPWWRTLDGIRQDVMTELCFNMGVGTLLTFSNTLAALKAKDWKRAAACLLASRWAAQVKDRSTRIAQMVVSGERG